MKHLGLPLACTCLFFSCTAPRSVLMTPDALPKGKFSAGINLDANIPTQTSEALYGNLKTGVNALYDRATGTTPAAITADSLNDYVKALLAYSMDPLIIQAGAYVRYGIWPRLDLGYHWNGGVNAFDLHWQFFGPLTQTTIDSGTNASKWRGSIGLQFSSQSYDLPSFAGLDKLQSLLQYEFKRKDLMIPIIFGKPFGAAGRYGSFGMGAVYNVGYISYESKILKLVERLVDGSTRNFGPIEGEQTVSSYGLFANIRGGYRWIYLVGSLSGYYQNYGDFKLFGGKTVTLKGVTIIPAAAVEFKF